jgi:magnesium transporter
MYGVLEWIAHGLMDSIVDTFFPLIGHIDHEVDEIDSLVIDPATKPRRATVSRPGLVAADLQATLREQNGIELSDRSSAPHSEGKHEKAWYAQEKPSSSRNPIVGLPRKTKTFCRDRLETMRLQYRFWKRQTAAGIILRIPGQALHSLSLFLGLNHFQRKNQNRDAAFRPVFDRSLMLRRITEMRRLTTGLTRLLGSKYQVVTRLKKRAAEENGDVGAYIGDVQGRCRERHLEKIRSSLSRIIVLHQIIFSCFKLHSTTTSTSSRIVSLRICPIWGSPVLSSEAIYQTWSSRYRALP